MDLYVFSCKYERNIHIGAKARLWAVSDIDQSSMAGRFTKSQSMVIGSRGLLYCSENKAFTTPFVVVTQPESVTSVVSGIWPESWALPFQIKPLGPSFRWVALNVAENSWKALRDFRNPTKVLNLGGLTTFVPSKIKDEDWNQIMSDLAFREGEL